MFPCKLSHTEDTRIDLKNYKAHGDHCHERWSEDGEVGRFLSKKE